MQWPEGMEPERATIHARNQIVIPVEPARVWRWLCRAADWPRWYSNCAWVRFRQNDGPDLRLNTAFVWKTFGVRVRSVVTTFEPYRELGWTAAAFGLKAYHGWLLTAAGDGCEVVTEETQVGPLTVAGRWFMRRALKREHQNWLERLREMSLRGDPP